MIGGGEHKLESPESSYSSSLPTAMGALAFLVITVGPSRVDAIFRFVPVKRVYYGLPAPSEGCSGPHQLCVPPLNDVLDGLPSDVGRRLGRHRCRRRRRRRPCRWCKRCRPRRRRPCANARALHIRRSEEAALGPQPERITDAKGAA
eukprot:1180264-Prorocentrum_minimum.AAC.2